MMISKNLSKDLFRGIQRNKTLFAILAIIPIMAWMFIFIIFPILYSFYISLYKTSLVGMRFLEFIGFTNYKKAIIEDPLFWSSLRRSGVFTAALLFIHLPLSFLVASGNRKKNCRIQQFYATSLFYSGCYRNYCRGCGF